jgi:hypothetical protein
MSDNIKKQAIKKALLILDALKCQYHIISEEGEEFGEPISLKNKQQRKYPHGALQNHAKKYLEGMEIGDAKNVPIGEFDIDSVQGAVCNFLRKKHGNGSYLSARGDDESGPVISALLVSSTQQKEEAIHE